MPIKTTLSEKEIDWAYEKWLDGHPKYLIAKVLHTTSKQIDLVFTEHGMERIMPPLVPPKE